MLHPGYLKDLTAWHRIAISSQISLLKQLEKQKLLETKIAPQSILMLLTTVSAYMDLLLKIAIGRIG